MQRKMKEPTFIDGCTADLGGPRMKQIFNKYHRHIDRRRIEKSVDHLYDRQPKAGRPHWPLPMMIKCLLLQKWFGLSDPQLEENLRDRLSFRQFVGLSLEDTTPDETTMVRFRKKLRDAGADRLLFNAVLKSLKARGLVMKEGTLVDATILEAPKGRKRNDGSTTRDEEASFTRKNNQNYHGYKGHIATDQNGMIRDYRFTTARVHDSQKMDELVKDERSAVYADSAYMDSQRKERLSKKGVFCGIIRRRTRGQKELPRYQKLINRVISSIRAVVEHLFAWMSMMGYEQVRYRGLRRNEFDFAVTGLAYNLKRSFSMLEKT